MANGEEYLLASATDCEGFNCGLCLQSRRGNIEKDAWKMKEKETQIKDRDRSRKKSECQT